MSIPVIDKRVKHVGATALRGLTTKALKTLEDVLVIQSADDEPLAVVLPYGIYLEIQQALWPASILPSLEVAFGPAALAQEEDARANDLTAPDDLHNTPPAFSVIGVDDTLRGAKFASFDDSQPPVVDDIDEKRQSEQAPGQVPNPSVGSLADALKDGGDLWTPAKPQPLCSHCNQPSDKTPCPTCFVAGHRNGNCLICAETRE